MMIRSEKVSKVAFWNMVFQVWRRNYLQFKRSWLVSLFWIVIEPLFVLGAMGFGLGSFVSTINGVSYADFFYPGLICMSSMFVSFFVSTYDNFSKLTYQKVFATQILSPIEPQEILVGEVLWAATKGTFSAFGVSVVAASIGLVDTWRIFPALGIVFLSSLVFSAFGMLVTTLVRNYDQIIYPSSGIIIPLSLFSGTYFPIEQLPYGLKYIAYISPLTHSTRAVRSLILTGFDWYQLVNITYLCVIIYFLYKVSYKRLAQKLLS